ncbi:uncharacterized protein LOC141848288 [Curcuma longa]|uniref:uncharacterized protein LOC141848288 n=1 Tax=Curcuma longa TaxID=136217 RepID=UPI003D9F9B4E
MDAANAMAFFHTSRFRSSTPAAMTSTSFSQFNSYNSVYNLLLFHRIDRDIYDRLIAHGATPLVARNIVALLVWLDNTGINVIPYLNNNFNDDAFLRLTAEAESILDFLRRAYLPPRESVVLSIPVIASLSTIGPINCGFFNCHRHEAAERIAETLAVGRFFFDNALFATFRRYEAAVEDARQCNTAPPPMPLELARPFMPVFSTAAASVDERSLVIAFLRASPLSEEEIAAYFQKQWGNCVERVAFEEMPASSSG